jgi:hypothetical protein
MCRLQGNNSEFPRNQPPPGKIRLENICEFSNLPRSVAKIPCASEQGINSTQQGMNSQPSGNEFATSGNREFISR